MKRIKLFMIMAAMLAFAAKAACQDYKVKDGLKYKIYKSNPGKKPAIGDVVMVDLLFYGDHDSLVFSSLERKQLVPIPVSKSQFKGDLMEGIEMLSVGDSAEFQISGDSIAKIAGPNAVIKPGSWMKYVIKVHSIFNEKDQEKIDEGIITDYIKKNKIEGVQHTADGLYYKITQAGTGDMPKQGMTVKVHYTGKFLDGNVFDSDKGAGLTFQLGKHGVIEGWDEAFALLNPGTKATLFIPSHLGYGVQGNGPIPPNTVLIFDVEEVGAL